MTSYLATGGDGYAFLQKEIIDRIVAGNKINLSASLSIAA